MSDTPSASTSPREQTRTPEAVRIDALDLCAEIFQGPDPEGFPALLGRELPELARRASACGSPLAGALAALAASLPRVDPASGSDLDEFLADLETAYVALFVSDKGGVPAPLYESCHAPGPGRLMGPPAEAMARRLEQAGLSLAEGATEPPDHLSIELEYMAYLLSEAMANGQPEPAALAEGFARQVLPAWRRWAKALAQAVEERARAAGSAEVFFLAAARLALAALEPGGSPESGPAGR